MKLVIKKRWVLLLIIFVILVFCFLQPHDPYHMNSEKILSSPSSSHWFGTDRLGRDLFSRTGLALRRTLLRAGTAEILSFTVAFLLSVIAQIYLVRFRWISSLLQRTVRLIPPLLFLFGLAVWTRGTKTGAFLGLFSISFIFAWPVFNAEIISNCVAPHVEGTIALGASPSYIIKYIIAPASLPRLKEYARLDFASLIAFEAFMGMAGIDNPPYPSLGNMIYQGRHSIVSDSIWLFLFPTLVFATILFIIYSIKIFKK